MEPRVSLSELLVGVRLLWSLPPYLRRPLTVESSRITLRGRFSQRERDFLSRLRRIYAQAGSPYRALLRVAGCELGDAQRLVERDGVEGTLQTLLASGVYLTVDEFKGRRPVTRGSATISVSPDALRAPGSTVHIVVRSGGSRGRRTPVGVDLADVRDEAVDLQLFLMARGGLHWCHAVWGVPGSSTIRMLLRLCASGASPARWFSQLDATTPDLDPRYRWAERMIQLCGRLAGVPLPDPEAASLRDPLPIARWIADTLQAGEVPHLFSYASAGVRLCQAAADAGIDLRGARLTLSGEPLTRARVASLRAAGIEALPRYASVESGHIGYGCLAPDAPDDLHLLHDLHAVVQPGAGGPAALPDRTLFITSLRSTPPFTLLNVALGDVATMDRRSCGCPMERIGWTTHLHSIRSYEKLTAGGMTFLDGDVEHVLEDLLPARFGGLPTDYQLVEEESDDGRPRLRLLVHPAVGALDPAAVSDAFLSGIGAASGTQRLMEMLWRDGEFLRVERAAPRANANGKILHLHQARSDRAR